MKYIYHCKHCHAVIDEIEASRDLEKKLGLSELTLEEKEDVLVHDVVLQRLYVKTICDHCYEVIKTNPELSLISNPLQ